MESIQAAEENTKPAAPEEMPATIIPEQVPLPAEQPLQIPQEKPEIEEAQELPKINPEEFPQPEKKNSFFP